MTSRSPSDQEARQRWLSIGAVAITLVLWASAFVAIRHLGHDFSPGALSLGRLAIGALALACVALPRGLPRPDGRAWSGIVVIGVLWYAVYMVALNEGERRVDAGTAAMLIQVSPVLVAVLAAIFLRERFTPRLGIGLALAFGGVAVIGLASSDSGGRDALGVALCLVSAAAYSVAMIVQKPLLARVAPIHVTWLACTIGAIVCLPFAPALMGELGRAPASSIWWLIYLGVFPTALAFTTYAYALQFMTASSLGITTYLVPVITIAMSALLLGEVPPSLAYVGGALALVGVGVARSTSRAGRRASLPVVEEPATER
ncbi:DMT family transporter [Nocardioides sp. R-C-SC26]|uniref:DMT family transporter n=1 Tax=Nocardioides sp. R-C-SC26 TaxID=2870414 RepID=UPI001E449273|nr:DMT family transporter [Nocardioides sp. R-C-SC26]